MWNLATCSCDDGKYVGSSIDDSVTMCDDIIEDIMILYSLNQFLINTFFESSYKYYKYAIS